MRNIPNMTRQLATPLIVLLLFVAMSSGCGKKKADYETFSTSMKPEGHQINTAGSNSGLQNENFGEGDLESLDESAGNSFSSDSISDEYKAIYGRSTGPLLPVYFDFDSTSIKPDQLENLSSSGKYLLENKGAKVVIEGNCDERGTADYNLALGELRAMNVKKHLVTLGIAEQRISTISFGSQRPLYHGSNEHDWAKNRRADLVMP